MKITIHRGDYAKKILNITDSSGNAVEFDEIYFTVKKSATYEDLVFQKTLTNGDIVLNDDGTYNLELLPEDTDGLDFRDYEFDIEVVKENPVIKQTFLRNSNNQKRSNLCF